MSAGRPVRKRVQGFSNDILALNRLRTALKIDHSLERNSVARAIGNIDSLIDLLAILDESKQIEKLS